MTYTEEIRSLRRDGLSLRAIAAILSISKGKVCRALYSGRAVTETRNSVIRHIPVIGWAGSTTCYHQPVSLPRVTIIDGAGAAA